MLEVPSRLRILLIEDRESDAKLTIRRLEKGGLEFTSERVSTEPELVRALEEPLDVILADYNLPGFDVRRALELAKQARPDTPVLVVSGSMHEELGVELMRLGADDYLLKDRLERLPSAVQRAIARAREDQQRRSIEERLTAILDNVPVVVFAFSPEGVLSLAQGRGLEAFGLGLGQLEGSTVRELFRDIPELQQMFDTATKGQHSARTVHLPRTDRFVDLNIGPVLDDDGDLDHVIGVAADVTDRRKAEQALMETDAKSRFLANMSHELRNPLNSVLGFAQLLSGQEVGGLSEKQLRYVNHIQTSGNLLLSLVNDVLDLSKVVSGQMVVSLEPIVVDTAIDICLTQMEPQAADREITLDKAGEPGLVAVADRQRLIQVLLNLLSNAIKFTPGGGKVTLVRSATPETVQVAVSDTGIGIPEDMLDYVFDEFAQIESSQTDAPQGTGLGLPLSRRLAELMGGGIEARSAVGRGSTFTLSIPRQLGSSRNRLPAGP
jgi:PAS domain S-box-containing protein